MSLLLYVRYFDLVRDLRHNKGEILKASVDYIRRMKSDLDASKESDAKRRALEQQNRQLHLKIQELEARLRQSGINVEETTLCPSLIPSLISADCQPQSQQMLKTENVKNSITPRRHNTPTSNYSPNMHDDQFSSTIVDHNLLMPSSDLLTRTLTPDDITREALTRDALSSDDLTPDDLTPLFPASDHLLGAQCNDASSKSHYEDTTCHYDDTSCHYEDNTCNDRSSDSLHNDNRKELLQDLNAHPFELDLMEDDPVSGVYSCDPLFSSPQVPSTP
ncbi:hypothetical protein HAZT_HAZT011519 [Hyalella azteca]|uniref:BHLH domain-containing protein n=1 Tax=Hyalella azteca TaxID=294128 RepID=A0A6A0H4E0_HYAAZ|nr:hypothetical protein HAZT_HAZT011519 [Hyalella azteca]